MSRSPLPPVTGEVPTKVIFSTSDPGTDAQQLLAEHAGSIKQFQVKARQQRELSGSPFATMMGRLPGGGRVRSVYNNGQEQLYVDLNPGGGEAPEPPPIPVPMRGTPQLAIDVVFEPSLYPAEDLFHRHVTEVAGTGGVPGNYGTWRLVTLVPTIRAILTAAYPQALDYFIDDGHGGSTIKHDGHLDYAAGGELVQWGENPEILTVMGSASSDPDDFQYELNRRGFSTAYEKDNLSDPAFVAQYDGSLAAITASAAGRMSATWAIIWQQGSLTWTYPSGTPLGDHGTSGESLSAVEFWYRPDGEEIVNIEDKIERFDVRNMVAVIADAENKDTYSVASLGMDTPPEPDEQKRLKWLDPDDSPDITVTRTLDAHEAGGAPGTFGAGFLAQMKHPPFGTSTEEVVFSIYVASVNSTATNTPPGPRGAVRIDDPSVTLDVDHDLKLRIRAREFIDTKTKVVKVETLAGTKTTHTETPGDSEVTYDGAGGGGGGGGGGEPPPPGSGGDDSPETVQWAFAIEDGWVDLGGEPSDPTAEKMGTLLVDSGPLPRTVVGPEDAADTFYTEVEWKGTIVQMTLIAKLRWQPAVEPGGLGSAKLELA